MKHDTPAAFEKGWSRVQRYLNAFIWNFERYALPGSDTEEAFNRFDSRLTNIYQEALSHSEGEVEASTNIQLNAIELDLDKLEGTPLERNSELKNRLQSATSELDNVWVTHVDSKLTPAGHFSLSKDAKGTDVMHLIANKCVELFYTSISGVKPDDSPVLSALIQDAEKHLLSCISSCAEHKGFPLQPGGSIRLILSPTSNVDAGQVNQVLHKVSAEFPEATLTTKNLTI